MDFYNTNYEITYEKYMKDDPDAADIHYKKNLIEVFNLDENSDFDFISDRVGKIYEKMKPYIESNEVFKGLLLQSAAKIMSNIYSDDQKISNLVKKLLIVSNKK